MNPLGPVVTMFKFTRHSQRRFVKQYMENPESIDDPELQFENSKELRDKAKVAEEELEDMAIVALFAVFQARVFDHLESIVDGTIIPPFAGLEKVILEYSLDKPDRWPFDDILDLYKAVVPPAIVGDIKQVYEYRNWVAHGRRDAKPINLDFRSAEARLTAFLTVGRML